MYCSSKLPIFNPSTSVELILLLLHYIHYWKNNCCVS